METSPPTHPATNLSNRLYYQLVHTLTGLLPPPLDSSPEALRARNHAAIAKVAALRPVNADELDLAAQCIAARAQAEGVLRLLREHADDIRLVMRLNAQYALMVRTSLSVHARLMRVQAVRQKREAIEGAADQDAWTMHIIEQSMLKVADPDVERLKPAQPEAASVAAPPPHKIPKIEERVSENKPYSHDMAFETWMSARPRDQVPEGSAETDLSRRLRKAMTESALAG